MTEGTSTSGAPAAAETAGPVAAVATSAATAAAPAPAPVDAQAAAMAAAAAMTAAPSAPAAKSEAPAVGPAAAALAAIEAAAAVEAAAAKKAAAEAKKDASDSEETSMSDAEVLPEVELASLGEAGAATAGQAGLPCGVLPVVDAPVAVAPPPVDVPVGDAGFALSPALLGLLGLGALGLGWLLLRDDDDNDDDDDVAENQAPVATDEVVAADEDEIVEGTLDATDPDGDEADLVFEETDDVAGLTINEDGTYEFDASVLDDLAQGETEVIEAEFTVTDADGGSDVGTITITVTGANDAPVLTADAAVDIDENMPAGTVVLDASATDATGDDVTFSLTGADAALFAINATTGVVTTVGPFDFETDSSFNITVVATDESGATDTQAVVVTVNDVNEVLIASLDVDDDNNTLTPFTIDADAEAYVFQDDDDIANNVVLIHFTADDQINFEAAASDIAYAAVDTGDGDGMNDLLITINNGGTVSEILIEDVADDSVFVFDEASAEAAVAGTDTFHAGVVLEVIAAAPAPEAFVYA